ncbi:MAG: T9SS type A sorting domain-containing protein, partial [Bacteroidetes bacterium]|nr:T9SS type A sorting domain-containing protein [Bacteroidota bacterium]
MKIKRFFQSMILFTLGAGPLFAQTYFLAGTVKDYYSNTPLDSAKVELIFKNIPDKRDSVYTDNFGNWNYTLTNITSENNFIPTDLTLSQNYPNPFNPSTKISFSINSTGRVKLIVHDAIGQEIESREFFLQSGNYTVDWFGAGAAGIYFYSIEFNGNRLTKKMIQLDGSNRGGFGNPYSNGAQVNFKKSFSGSINLDLMFSRF